MEVTRAFATLLFQTKYFFPTPLIIMSNKVCLTNKECPTGYCLAGTCTDPSSYLDPCSPTHPEPCSSATYSSGGTELDLTCSTFSHLCVLSGEDEGQEKGKCDTAVHCPVGKYCPAVVDTSGGSGTTRKCQSRKAGGAECQRQEECIDGLECYMGHCRRRVQMITMAECGEKEKQVAVASTKYGVCIPSDAPVVPVKATKTESSEGGEGNATLWIVGSVAGIAIIGLTGVLVFLAHRKGYIGKKRGNGSNI